MLPEPDDDIRALLADLECDGDLRTLARLGENLRVANRTINLTRLSTPRDYWLGHVADSLLALHFMPSLRTEPLRIADVGCGAGFPLLVLAWANPAATLTGIEATAKKVDFIRNQIAELGLPNVTACHAQAREAARQDDLAGAFDLVVARAVGPTAKLLKDARGLLATAPSSALLSYKTPQALAEEQPLTRREAEKFGYDVSLSPVFDLPGQGGPRQFILCRQRA
jgi:16S rRNA (guanine527-N7)-methyltransferase